MKTAEELFDKYKTGYYGNEEFETKSLYIEEFILALTEYKSDIIKMIDGMIDDKNGYWIASEQDYYDTTVLHELKQKIEKS